MTISPAWLISDRREMAASLTPQDNQEFVRAERLKSPDAVQDFLHARATARRLVAAETGLMPAAVRLRSHDDSVPTIIDRPDAAISWSKSGPLAFSAFMERGWLGCDIERVRPIEHLAMLDMIATDTEAALIRGLTGASQEGTPAAFFRLWSAKEAVLKWQGSGLRGGAKSVEVPVPIIMGNDTVSDLVRNGVSLTLMQVETPGDRVAMLAFSEQRPA
ncbi:4'-phosphopantetheinyl transferase superfamily protein [Henriciella sp. AS95]|uniref:4'-phosphopantetheinyl transferase family protein n=1 Tax=Henriciella sp. AS95 TaxID=3135782 RepID=UPI00317554BE